MDLKLKDIAEMLNVSKTTIRRWLRDGKIPAYLINNQYRFNRHEIEDWVMRQRVGDSVEFEEEEQEEAPVEEASAEGTLHGGSKQFGLYRAIHKGGVLDEILGGNKDVVIANTMELMAHKLGVDCEVATELLLDRERLMPTALNNGIGVPHTRECLLEGPEVVIVVFPEIPLNYGALDGKPVHTLFFLFASDDRRHLHLLAKIAHLASQPETLEFLRKRPKKDQLLGFIKEWEANIQHQAIMQES